jgi:hypothetical protein
MYSFLSGISSYITTSLLGADFLRVLEPLPLLLLIYFLFILYHKVVRTNEGRRVRRCGHFLFYLIYNQLITLILVNLLGFQIWDESE